MVIEFGIKTSAKMMAIIAISYISIGHGTKQLLIDYCYILRYKCVDVALPSLESKNPEITSCLILVKRQALLNASCDAVYKYT